MASTAPDDRYAFSEMSSTTRTLSPWLVAALCVAVSFALFIPSLSLSFFADDFLAVWRIGALGDMHQASFFRPLSEFTIWVNHFAAGTSPAGYRAFNVLVHALNAVLVYLLMQRTPGLREVPNATGMALVAAVLFLAYPFHNESIVWIVGRGTSLATFFTLASLVALSSGLSERGKLIIVPLFFFLGALAYESMLLFPLIVLPMLLRGCEDQRPFRKRLGVALIAVLLLHFMARWAFTGQLANAYGSAFFDHTWSTYPLNAVKVLGRLFLPPSHDEHMQGVRFVLLLALLSVAAFPFWRSTERTSPLRATILDLGWMLGIVCLVGIIAGVSTRTSESDRFLYMPSAFLCMLIAIALFSLLGGIVRWATLALLVIGSVILLQRNTANWKDASTTIERIVADLPPPPDDGRLFVTGTPGEFNGAFIFRHGFHEALLLAGRDTARIVRVDRVLWEAAEAQGVPALSSDGRSDTLFLGPNDRETHWFGDHFSSTK